MINNIKFNICNKTNQKINVDYIKLKIYEITKQFNIEKLNKIIKIFIYDNAVDCGKAYGEDDPSPCNGFTRLPNQIHVINSQSLIVHELTHIIMYIAFGKSKFAFIREGFAEFFQSDWNGKMYEQLLKEISINNFEKYLNNENFYNENSDISYPFAGVFIKKLVQNIGINKALNLYVLSVKNTKKFLELLKQVLQ